MKKRISIVVAILLLAVGFAALSTTLIINGSTKVGENTYDFNVIFITASLDWSWKNELEVNATVIKAKETLNGIVTVTLNKVVKKK